jgi:alpha-galactosidase
MNVADAIVSLGLAAVGYEYVNTDDCWQVDRTPNGTIIPDPVRFPSGIAALSRYIESRGLKFGLYTAQAEYTCQNRPGSWRFETIDIDTYCAWGVSYVKTDGCNGRRWAADNVTWIDFHAGIARCEAASPNRTIVLSVESCGDANCGAWIAETANLWRTTGDIQATWESVMSNLDNNDQMASFAGPGHWNDPDLLQVGNAGLSLAEARSHMAAWCVVAAPLLISNDLVSGIDAETLSILSAPEVIAVDQDVLGVQGTRVSAVNATGPECWARPLADGSVAVLLLNRGSATDDVTCTFSQVGLKGDTASVRDLWTRTELGTFTSSFTAKGLTTHASKFVKVSKI